MYEGTLNGSKVCVKRVRAYSVDGPDAAKKVLMLLCFLFPVADGAYRRSVKKP